MTDDALDDLIGRLNRGDQTAIEPLLAEFEPQVRMAVRRQLQGALRVKLDSMDVVQAVWVDVLAGFRNANWKFEDRRQVKAFLLTLARHRLIDRRRHFKKAIEQRERPLGDMASREAPAAHQFRPSEEAQGRELWEQMLGQCPPAHREILRLKREGRPLSEIAAATGLHEGSVRRILYELARKMTRTSPTAPPS